MSSGSETRKRSTRLPNVRCTSAELDGVKAAADHVGLTLSQLVRNRVFQASSPPGPRPRKRKAAADVVALVHISGLLGKYGSNLNQIARDANSGGEIVRAQEIWELAAQVKELQALVRSAFNRGDEGRGE